jgi:hypothetical protein
MESCGDSGYWAHGQVLDALRDCSSRNYVHAWPYGPVTVLCLHESCGVGVRTGCPILLLDLFTEQFVAASSSPM